MILPIETELDSPALPVRKSKPSQMSPTFERSNLERLKKCSETTESAKRLIHESKKLTQESHELVERIRKKRKASD